MGTRLEKKSTEVRKRIESHTFSDEQGEEYGASKYGGFSDYMRRKKIKLQNLDAELRSRSEQNPPIFRGTVIYVNGYTQPSLSDIHNLVVSHGGGFLQYLDGKTAVTHVIASHLTPKKKVEFARYRIVKPAWIVDSIKAGKLLPWDDYRLVDEGATQKVLNFDSGQFTSQANLQKQSYREYSGSGRYVSPIHHEAQDLDEARDEPEKPFQVDSDIDLPDTLSTEDLATSISMDKTTSEMRLRPNAEAEFTDEEKDTTTVDGSHALDGEEYKLIGRSSSSRENSDSKMEQNVHEVDDRKSNKEIVRRDSPEKRQLTAEEHNAILLSNPHFAKSSTANPDFLNQYYRESRLHHLSAWKADLKAQLQARAQEKSSQKMKQKRNIGARRYIMHVDFDSFFAAVSLRKSPHLNDKPVVIAHGSGPGSEIASCNYPARKFGVKNGMWMKTALGLCPQLNVLPYDFKAYEDASRHFYDSILSVDGIVQSISIDEALVDVSDQCIKAGGSDGKTTTEGSIYREQEKAREIAQKIRDSVKEKTGCEVSVGIGNNILLAKAALRKAKPAGQHLVKPEDVLDFLGELIVTDLPGVAWSIGNKLEEMGVKFVRDIRNLTKERLVNTLGPKTGEKIWDYSRGIDKQEVGDQVVRKSVSAEINWGIRFINQQQAEEFVQCLSDELSKRLLDQVVKGRQLTMKIMRKAADAGMDPPKNLGHGKCDTFNKSFIFGVATNDKTMIGREAISILRSYGFPPGELRGLGVQMQKLEPLKPVLNNNQHAQHGGQRRLQFKKPEGAQVIARSDQPIKERATTPHPENELSTSKITHDAIEEIVTPKKIEGEKKISGALDDIAIDTEEDYLPKPLNIGGTQFVMPSQVDPAVLQELPQDIRQKFALKQKSITKALGGLEAPPENKSRSVSPNPSDNETALPNQSQLDPEIMAALPEEVRQELIAHYRNIGNVHNPRNLQQILPQSPRKPKYSTDSKNQILTPTKKVKTVSLLTKGRSKTNDHGASTLTQTNFVSAPKVCDNHSSVVADLSDEISQSFLQELPEEIRLEILAEQKRNRMKTKSGLDIGNPKRKMRTAQALDSDNERGQQKLHLPKKHSRPVFTSKKLTTLPELRDAMSSWVQEFSSADEDGPFPEDVEALCLYLTRVVTDECDMSKAVAVVDWVAYLVESQPSMTTQVRTAWDQSVSKIRNVIQLAVQKRNLPPVRFGNPPPY